MKLTIPGILFTALIVASPVAFAQNTGYSGTTSNRRECSKGRHDQGHHDKAIQEAHGQLLA